MTFALYIFWISAAIVFYTYIGYGIILWVITKLKRKDHSFTESYELPPVTLLVAAYNEEDFIKEKILDTLSLDYPKDKLTIAIVTDGSSDRTPDIVKEFPGVILFHSPERKGKIHAVNRVMPLIATPIVVFSDANTFLSKSSLLEIVKHYEDEKTGGVAGEKRVEPKDTSGDSSVGGEGLYWKYESWLKKKDAEITSVVGAAGELFSIRTKLFEAPAEDMIIEDFYMSLKIASKGHRFAYEPKAYAIESGSASIEEEWKRKVRICAGAFQAMLQLRQLLNPVKYGMLSFQYVSHRVLRWTLAPVALVLLLLTNIMLISDSNFYLLTLFAQAGFYLLATVGYMLRARQIKIKGFFVPMYFTMMQLAVFAGFIRFAKGGQSVVWEKALRSAAKSTPSQ